MNTRADRAANRASLALKGRLVPAKIGVVKSQQPVQDVLRRVNRQQWQVRVPRLHAAPPKEPGRKVIVVAVGDHQGAQPGQRQPQLPGAAVDVAPAVDQQVIIDRLAVRQALAQLLEEWPVEPMGIMNIVNKSGLFAINRVLKIIRAVRPAIGMAMFVRAAGSTSLSMTALATW